VHGSGYGSGHGHRSSSNSNGIVGVGEYDGYYSSTGIAINPLLIDEYSYDNVYFIDEYGNYYPRYYYYFSNLWPWW
jgi:hypothetical protein